MTFRAGIRFARYEIVSRLALGGMADVWLGLYSGAGGYTEPVAVKTILPELAGSPLITELFERESRIAINLDHPNVVPALDFGEHDGTRYIAMEYIEGHTLREILLRAHEEQQLPPLWFSLRAFVRVCDAVEYLHSHGVLHHDISPENVMVSYIGATKLIDFGAAEPPLTRPRGDSIVGKFRYVAPERIEGGIPDGRADVYALGVLLYELTTGVRPFDGDEVAVVRAILRGGPDDPRVHNPALPRPLADLILRAMARELCDRPPSARLLAGELADLVDPSIEDADLGMYTRALFAEDSDLEVEMQVLS
jgi:serine/threonine-protein kinase